MFKRFVSVAAVCSFVCVSSPAAFAQSADVYDPHAHFGYPSQVSGGLYIRVPFNGGLKRSSNEEARFGFALKTTMPQKYSYTPLSHGYSFQGSANRQIKFLDISIGPSGFKSFKLNGQSFAEINALYADEEGKKKKKVWPWVLGGAALGVGILVAVVFAACDNEPGPLGTRTC